MSEARLGAVVRVLYRIAEGRRSDEPHDGQLLERFAFDREPAAFEALLRRHGPMVRHVCNRVLGDAHAAEDAFQATFLVLARKAGTLDRRPSVANWLYTVAVRLARKAKRLPDVSLSDLPPVAAPRSDPLEELSARELCSVIDEELTRLPERYRAPLILCCLEGRTRDEAAQQLGLSIGTVKGRLERGRERLRQRLARRGVSLPAAFATGWLASGSASVADAAVVKAMARAAIAFVTGDAAVSISMRALRLAGVGLQTAAVGPLRLVSAGVLLLGLLTAGVGFTARTPTAILAPIEDQPATAAPLQTKLDRYGDPLPPGAIGRLGTMRFRQGGNITRLVLTPDGSQFITSGYGSGIRFWDAATGRLIRRVPSTRYSADDIALLPGGARLVSAGASPGPARNQASGGIRIWDVLTGAELLRAESLTLPQQQSLATSPDGKLFATCRDYEGPIYLWDAANGQRLRQIGDAKAGAFKLDFSPDGGTLLATGDGQIDLWDVATGRNVTPSGWNRGPRGSRSQPFFFAAAFSPDGQTVATNGKGSETPDGGERFELLLLDRAGGPTRTLAGHGRNAEGFAFTPDGRDLISSGGNSLVRWDLASGRPKWQADGLSQAARSIVFSADGKVIATGGYNGVIRSWDAATGKSLRKEDDWHEDRLNQIGLSPDGRWAVTAGADGTIRVWNSNTARQQYRINLRDKFAHGCAISPDGRLLATTDEPNAVHLRDLASGRESLVFRGRDGGARIREVYFSPDGGRLTSLSHQFELQTWDVSSGHLEATIALIDFPRGPGPKQEQMAETLSVLFESLELNPSPRTEGKLRLLPALHPPGVCILDLAGRPGVRTIPDLPPRPAVLLPDGRHLISANGVEEDEDGTLHVHDVATGQKRYQFQVGNQIIGAMAIAQDGRTLAVTNRVVTGPIRLIELASGQEVRSIENPNAAATCFDFSPDSRQLVAGYWDSTALIWDLVAQPSPSKTLDQLWNDLAGEARLAHAAVWGFACDPARSVPILRERLKPAVAPDVATVQRLIDELDSDRFAGRETATRELTKLGALADSAFQDALKKPRSPESRQRIQALLDAPRFPPPPDEMRQVRAVQALEYADHPAARELLRSLAGGAAAARLTREAHDALQRLDRRGPPRPP